MSQDHYVKELKAIPLTEEQKKHVHVGCDDTLVAVRLGFSVNPAYVEVKSVSLVKQGQGRFPDAPTKRGVKHVKGLMELCAKGYQAVVVFVSQRSDTRSITCNDDVDPVFGEWLRKALDEGVELYGMNCKVTPTTISLNKEVEVIL